MSSLAQVLSDGGYRQDRGEANLTRFVDCELDGLIAECFETDAVDIEEVRSGPSSEHLYTLIWFARRAVVLGLREKSQRWVERAAHALAVASASVDPRDALWAASMVASATVDVGAPTAAVRSALEGASANVAQGFDLSVERVEHAEEPWRGTLFSVVTTRWGLGLVGRGTAVYNPRVDLLAVAMQIGDALDADRYLAEDPTIATKLPGIWVGSKGSDRSVTGLGCASIGATDWDRSSRWDRMFNVWLIESRSIKRASKLAKQAIDSGRKHARFAVAEGPLTCVIVARPTTVGVSPDETNESLLRYEKPCTDAMRTVGGHRT